MNTHSVNLNKDLYRYEFGWDACSDIKTNEDKVRMSSYVSGEKGLSVVYGGLK